MARGFASKSVADQQEEAQRQRSGGSIEGRPSTQRRTLELARADLLSRLQRAPERQKEMLRQALTAVEEQLRQS